MLAHLSLSISFALLHFRVESAAQESHQRTLPVFLAARTTRGALRYSIPAGAFVTVHPCTVTKGFGVVPRPFASLRAVNPASITLLGSSDGGNVKSTLREKMNPKEKMNLSFPRKREPSVFESGKTGITN